MTSDLAAKSCEPCRGGIPPLDHDQAEQRRREVPEWSLKDDATRIERNYTFADFKTALSFVDAAGAIAETEGHHPDITFGWGYAILSVQTHKIKGLHDNDFILAAKCDRAYDASVRR